MSRSLRLVPVLLAAALFAVGCGSTADTTSTGTTTPSTPGATGATGPSQAPTTTARPPTSGAYSTTPVSVAGEGGTALLAAVRAAAQDGFDRVTFEFTNRVPGYAVGYSERPIVQDGSGNEVALDGSAVLKIAMTPASGTDLSGGGRPTNTGPARFKPGTPMVVEVVQVGDFEGRLTWVAGVSAAAGFKVSTLTSPPRLVVDIKSG